MRIVDRKTFLALPEGVMFAKYGGMGFGELFIKGESRPNDFYYQEIADPIACESSAERFDLLERAEKTGESFSLDFNCQARDGLFDGDQLFPVWEIGDIMGLEARLESVVPAIFPIASKAEIANPVCGCICHSKLTALHDWPRCERTCRAEGSR